MKAVLLAGHGGFTTHASLVSFFGAENVASLFVKDLLALLRSKRDLPDLVALPGGSSQEIGNDFGEEGKCVLQDYVREGGRVLGVCAGAAVAGRSTVFYPIGHDGITTLASHRLELLPVDAVGPLPPPPGYQGLYARGTEEVVGCPFVSQETLRLYYGGGCAFCVPEGAPVEVWASFKRLVGERSLASVANRAAAAIVYGRVGKGEVLLCGVHPDVKWQHMEHLRGQHGQGKYRPASYHRPNPAEGFMTEALQSLNQPANEPFWTRPDEWFHDVIMSRFMGCEPVHKYASGLEISGME